MNIKTSTPPLYVAQGLKKSAKSISHNLASALRKPSAPPIYVCGHARSGTSWVASTLAQQPGTLYYHEPSDGRYWGWTNIPEQTGYFRLETGQENNYFQQAFDAPFAGRWSPSLRTKLKERISPRCRIVVKDVWTSICPSWVIDQYKPTTVFIVRHPCAVVASQLERKLDSYHGLNALEKQGLIPSELSQRVESMSEVERLATIWAVTTRYMLMDSKEYKTPLHIISYEDFALNPKASFMDLAEKLMLGTDLTEIENFIDRTTQHTTGDRYSTTRKSSERINLWKSVLSSRQIKEVRTITRIYSLLGSPSLGNYEHFRDYY